MISPGIWRTRGGALVSVKEKVRLGYMSASGRETIEVWTGSCLDCGARFTWEISGNYSPVSRHDLDLVAPDVRAIDVPRDCPKSHTVARIK